MVFYKLWNENEYNFIITERAVYEKAYERSSDMVTGFKYKKFEEFNDSELFKAYIIAKPFMEKILSVLQYYEIEFVNEFIINDFEGIEIPNYAKEYVVKCINAFTKWNVEIIYNNYDDNYYYKLSI